MTELQRKDLNGTGEGSTISPVLLCAKAACFLGISKGLSSVYQGDLFIASGPCYGFVRSLPSIETTAETILWLHELL